MSETPQRDHSGPSRTAKKTSAILLSLGPAGGTDACLEDKWEMSVPIGMKLCFRELDLT